MPIKSYKDLTVWQAGVQLVTDVYRLTAGFPKSETFGLSNQIQRSAVSIPSNIAEGHARLSDKEFHHFLTIALGSLAELETQLVIAENLGYAASEKIQVLLKSCDELGKQIRKLQQAVKKAATGH
jgi:four helix bundle protein